MSTYVQGQMASATGNLQLGLASSHLTLLICPRGGNFSQTSGSKKGLFGDGSAIHQKDPYRGLNQTRDGMGREEAETGVV